MGMVDLSKYGVRVELSRGQPDARFLPVFAPVRSEGLLQRRLDLRESRVQLRPETRDYGDDRHRDAGSDQAVFDSRCRRLVTTKLDQMVLHDKLSLLSDHLSTFRIKSA
jgi:hypothetical protein